jgi:uncharacterized protein GlcG (DUF336 family)
LSRNDPDRVSHRLQLSCEPLRAWAGFHTHHSTLGALKKCTQSVSAELNPLDNIPGAISPDYVKDILAQVDSVDSRASRFIANHIRSQNAYYFWVIRRSRTISGETSIMSRTLMLLASAATLAVTLATPASAQLLQRKDLSLSIALAIANSALEACKAMGYAASVVVVDRAGETLVSLRGDGSGPHTVENARRKAYTANTFKMSTEAFVQDMKTRPVRREQTTLPHVIAINGGVPIKVGNDVIGGVGLSGSPGKDEECVNAGLEKVKQQLQ